MVDQIAPPSVAVHPFVRVNPCIHVRLLMVRQRLVPPASIVVNNGPLTLITITGLPINKPPLYTPFVTSTTPNGEAISIAFWIFVAAVAQVE